MNTILVIRDIYRLLRAGFRAVRSLFRDEISRERVPVRGVLRAVRAGRTLLL